MSVHELNNLQQKLCQQVARLQSPPYPVAFVAGGSEDTLAEEAAEHIETKTVMEWEGDGSVPGGLHGYPVTEILTKRLIIDLYFFYETDCPLPTRAVGHKGETRFVLVLVGLDWTGRYPIGTYKVERP